jgi:DNA-binding NtrC family response regulator
MEKRNLLVVDDELLIRDLLYDHFASKDFQIATADSAEQAMEILDGDQQFDVVLTDIKMGGMDGLQLVDHIKRNHADLPVIIMTGFPSLETAIEALRKRVYDYVIKPFNINRLCAVVEAAVDEYQQRKKPALEGIHV